MGSRGPAPSPSELRLLKGNGKDRDVAGRKVGRQARTVLAAPAMPDGLGEFGEGMWRDVVPELERMGVLGQIDRGILEAYCRTYDIWRRHDGRSGYAALTTTMAGLGAKILLDPSARARFTMPEAAEDETADIFGTGTG